MLIKIIVRRNNTTEIPTQPDNVLNRQSSNIGKPTTSVKIQATATGKRVDINLLEDTF